MAVNLSATRSKSRSLARAPRAPHTNRVTEAPNRKQEEINQGPLDQYLGFYLRRLYDSYRKHFVSEIGEIDLQPREAAALVVVSLNPGLTPKELGGALALDGAQTTGMLNLFESRQLLERRISSTDARSRLVYLTDEGERVVEGLYPFLDAFDQTFCRQSLSGKELRQLLGLLAKLSSATER